MIGQDQVIQLLTHAVRNNASDIHLSEGYPPIVRIDGKLQPLKGKVLSKQDTEDIVVQILDDYQMEKFKKNLELDFGYIIKDIAHFRVNVFEKMGGIGMAFRIIPDHIRTLAELGMPKVYEPMLEGAQRAKETLPPPPVFAEAVPLIHG